MRRFFILTEDSRPKGVEAVVPNYPVFDMYFEYYQVSKCQSVPDDCLLGAQLLANAGRRVDLVGNPLGWVIVSPAMLRVFSEFASDHMQILRFDAVNAYGQHVLEDYRVVNVLSCLEGVIDLTQSVTSRHKIGDKHTLNIITPVFRVGKIPATTHVFRPRESMFTLVVSEEFAEAMQKEKLKGFALVETGSV